MAVCVAISLKAQTITDGSHWFDGSAWYTATELEGSILFRGDSADGTYTFEFRLERTKAADTYRLMKATNESIVPFRTEYGTKVKAVGKGGATLTFLDEDGLTSWTLVRTDKSQRDCLATEFWAKSQPLEKMASSYVMNTHYLSVLSKTQLRYMQELLMAKQSLSYVEQTNLELIGSELKVPDFHRINVGDLQALSEAQGPKTVTVTDELGFLDALKDNTKIILPEGTRLNLSKVLGKASCFKGEGRAFEGYVEPHMQSGESTLVSESVFDGKQLTIVNLKNVTICGSDDCHIVVDPAYAYVLNFVQCENINIENVTMGHTAEGYCTGGVVGMYRCSGMEIDSCDLYGCGAYGLVADMTQGVTMTRTIIRDCSYGIMQLFGCSDAIFSECSFYRNREYSLVTVDAGCRNILFEACRFFENRGLLFDLQSRIQLKSCGIVHNDPGALGDFRNHVQQLDEETTIRIENY
jgi:hypothetical protein